MRNLPGNRKKLFAALLPIVVFVVSLLSAASCKAQNCLQPYGFANNPTTYWYDPTITSVSPSTWVAGQTYNITIAGTGLVDVPDPGFGGGCSLNATLTNTGSVTLSNISFVNATQITATVTVDASDPSQTACLTVGGVVELVVRQLASTNACPASKIGGVTGPGSATAQVQIVGGGPTITSVSPSNWFASQSYNITITGTGFLTASDSGGPTQLTATVSSGSATLSNVRVNSVTQITATVKLSNDATTEPATLTAANSGGGSGSGIAQVYALPVITDTTQLQDAIVSVNLSAPGGTTGNLVPDFHGTDASGTTIDSGLDIPSLAPGQQEVDLDFDSITPAIYTKADGNWYPVVPPVVMLSIPSYTLPTPWTYFRKIYYTQYNVPHESACSGGDSDAWIVSTSTVKGKTVCSFQKIKLNSQFIAATWLNGTGVDGDGDILKNAVAVNLGSSRGEVCYGQYPEGAVGHGNGNAFEIVSSITGSCSRMLVPDQSVAIPCAQSGHRCLPSVLSGVQALSCGSQLNLDSGDHTTAYTRTAADLCPACSNTSAFFDESSPMYGADGHIDAFSSNVSCTGKGVGSLGFFYTSYPTN